MTFKESPPGFQNVDGPLVQSIQDHLHTLGFDPGPIDGLWGKQTDAAIKSWQQANKLLQNGVIDDKAWQALVQTPVPPLSQRSLQLTGAWEGTGYSDANGNFDGEGITWGVVGFTWANGELQGILQEIQRSFPSVFSGAFGPLESTIVKILAEPRPNQMNWANSISIARGSKITPQWATCFKKLGDNPDVQALENQHAQHYWTAGSALAEQFGLTSDRGLALCFDIAVQDTVTRAMTEEIDQQTKGLPEADKLSVIAHVVANNANPKYFSDVLRRKMTFAVGTGTVHDANYDISCWGIG